MSILQYKKQLREMEEVYNYVKFDYFYRRNINFSFKLGFVVAKLFYCLLEWLMVIPSSIFTDTDLCQLVLDVIDLAFEDRGV
jgi:hypothetical protein